MKFFKHSITGKIAQLPDHFEAYDYLEEVDPNDYDCQDCGIPDEPEPVDTEPIELDEPETIEYNQYAPIPRPPKRR